MLAPLTWWREQFGSAEQRLTHDRRTGGGCGRPIRCAVRRRDVGERPAAGGSSLAGPPLFGGTVGPPRAGGAAGGRTSVGHRWAGGVGLGQPVAVARRRQVPPYGLAPIGGPAGLWCRPGARSAVDRRYGFVLGSTGGWHPAVRRLGARRVARFAPNLPISRGVGPARAGGAGGDRWANAGRGPTRPTRVGALGSIGCGEPAIGRRRSTPGQRRGLLGYGLRPPAARPVVRGCRAGTAPRRAGAGTVRLAFLRLPGRFAPASGATPIRPVPLVRSVGRSVPLVRSIGWSVLAMTLSDRSTTTRAAPMRRADRVGWADRVRADGVGRADPVGRADRASRGERSAPVFGPIGCRRRAPVVSGRTPGINRCALAPISRLPVGGRLTVTRP